MAFECVYDAAASKYTTFRVTTRSRWAPARLEVVDSGRHPDMLPGFANLEAGLVLLTHPLRGYFFRQDGELGSYAIWHDRVQPTTGELREADYPLLGGLGLWPSQASPTVQSVPIQRNIDFTIYLPPTKVR